jgi:hypothetical protein
VKAIYALFTEADDVQRAVDGLRAAGLTDLEITVISSEPIEGYEFSRRDRATWIYWIASGGAALGLLTAVWLTRMTQLAWPLTTGNMPIVSWWPNLIIMFEMTMLGAILATVATLLVTAKLPMRDPALYDREVADGKILVGVSHPRDAVVGAIEGALASVGAAEVRRV